VPLGPNLTLTTSRDPPAIILVDLRYFDQNSFHIYFKTAIEDDIMSQNHPVTRKLVVVGDGLVGKCGVPDMV
jgi:hypothetical protein